MIRLVINGRDADVLQTETIVGEYAIAPIGDISKRVGARSIQFKLPKTSNNKAIFESSEIATSTSKIPYRNLPCRIYVDGVDMNMQFCILESVDDNYNIRMYGGNSVLFDWLKDRKLADLNLRHLNHHWDVDYINEISAKDYPVKYPIIDFNSDSPNSAIDETHDYAWMGTFLPCIYEHYLIEKCINEAGYSLNNETANSLMFVDNIPAVPLGSKKYERDEDFDRLIGKFAMSPFSGSPTGLLWNANSIIYQNQVYWEAFFNSNLSYGGAFCMPDAVKVKVRLIADLQNGVADESVYIDVFSTFNGSYSLVTTYAVLVPIAGQLVDETIELDCKYPDVGLGFIRFGYEVRSISATNVYCYDATLEILEATKLEDENEDLFKPIGYRKPFVAGIYDYVTVANNLPDFTQAEFIKQYMLRTNSICTIDERNKVFTIVPYKKLKDDIGLATDWSGKLDFTNKPKVEFDLDYAQNNYLKYKDDTKVIKPVGTDKTFTIDDSTLEYEKTIIQLTYSACESVKRVNRNIANIKVFESLEFKDPSTPRIVLIRFEDFTFIYRQNDVNNTDAVTITTDVPIGLFIDTEQEYSNGFDNDLFNQFFLFITGVIDYAKVIECEMRLTTLDIANFDPLKPVYIREFDAHFYVNKIKFEYTSRKSSVVELIKLL